MLPIVVGAFIRLVQQSQPSNCSATLLASSAKVEQLHHQPQSRDEQQQPQQLLAGISCSPPQVQHVLSALPSPSLLTAARPWLPAQRMMRCKHHTGQVQQQQQQLWPSQRSCLHTSPALMARTKGSRAAVQWPGAVPRLHQPRKHLAGDRTPRGRPQGAARQGGSPEAAAAEAAGSSQPQAQPESAVARLMGRVNVTKVMLVIVGVTTFIAGAYAVLVVLQAIVLGGTPGALRTGEAVAQKTALGHLQYLLRLRQYSPEVVGELINHGILAELVALVMPGTDTLVLIEVCGILQSLSESPLALAALQQAGLPGAVQSALQEGWAPTGALNSLKRLNKALQPA